MTPPPLISCVNLNFGYTEKPVLENISLELYPGQFVAVLGQNGAGKSSLLACLCGLTPCDFEHLTVDGLDLSRAGRREIAKRLSFVPQNHEDMFPFTVLDVIVMGRTVFSGRFGAPARDDYDRAWEVIREFQIDHLARRCFTDLSGGEKQMVLLARAIVQTRRIVFLDEPTNHLDYSNRFKMLSYLKSLTREHHSCVVASLHDPNHALAFADRAILIHDHKVLDAGPVNDVLTGQAVSRLYGIATWTDSGNGPDTLSPAFIHNEFKDRILILTGASGQGKTTLLEQVIRENPGIDFGGFICPGIFKNQMRYQSSIHAIAMGQTAEFTRRADDSPRSHFQFFEQGFSLAKQALDPLANQSRHCMVVDEIGPLELKGKGFADLVPPLLSLRHCRHIWVVRPRILKEVCKRWMISDPEIVQASQPDALERITGFLNKTV